MEFDNWILRPVHTAKLAWEQRSITTHGATYNVPRLTAWCGEMACTYSGITHPPAPWPDELPALRQRLEDDLGVAYNCVLGNLYRDGRDRVRWHADNEALFGQRPVIASISLGGERRFAMRHLDDPARRSRRRYSTGRSSSWRGRCSCTGTTACRRRSARWRPGST